MSIAQSILPEFEQEMDSTRKVLERVPDDKLDWKAHPKSNTIGWNANHIAEMPGWVPGIVNQESWDINPTDGEGYQSPAESSRQAILDVFDKNVATAKEAIAATTDEAFAQEWSLLGGGQPLFTLPRIGVIRTFVINHIIHHRAILTVYLRLNDVPVPGMYGPSGDENG